MREEFAREIIEGTSAGALQVALSFYENTERRAKEVLNNLENLASGEILQALHHFPPQTQARLLLYMALRGEAVKERAVEMAGYLDGEGPDAVALKTVLGLEKATTPEKYGRFLRKNFHPFSLTSCRLHATASRKIISGQWDRDLFLQALFCLRFCPDDFIRTPLLLPLLEVAGRNLESVLQHVLDFQRGMLFDYERAKVLVKTAEVLKEAGLLDLASSEEIILAIREIETKVFRFWALKEVSRIMAEAGLRERALELSRNIENPFWKGATAYELLQEGERSEDLQDPFWKLMVDLKTHPERQGEVIEDFLKDPYIPDGIKLPSLEIVLPLLSGHNQEKVKSFLAEKGWTSTPRQEEKKPTTVELSQEDFLKMPLAEREEEAKRLAETVEFNQRSLPFFMEVLYHPQAVDILLSRKVEGEDESQALRVLRILQERVDKAH